LQQFAQLRPADIDVRVSILSYRALALLSLGYPDAALTDADRAVEHARDAGQSATLMYALVHASLVNVLCAIMKLQKRLLMKSSA
jgi:hypothetical protein